MYAIHKRYAGYAAAERKIADTPTNRKTRSARPMPHCPASRSRDHV